MIGLNPLFPDHAALTAAENTLTERLDAVRRASGSRKTWPSGSQDRKFKGLEERFSGHALRPALFAQCRARSHAGLAPAMASEPSLRAGCQNFRSGTNSAADRTASGKHRIRSARTDPR